MNENFLNYTGLTKYTKKIETYIDSKIEGLVPETRKVNAKELTGDINLTAYDVDAVPITRQINGHQLGFDLTLTPADLNAVPTSRTVNGKALTDDIVISADDIEGLSTPDLSGYVPTSRTVNGKALTTDISLNATDVGARPSTWSPDLSGYVPTSRTINGYALTSNVTLGASDVGALPITGGTLTGNLTIKGSGNYGTKINLGDGDYVHISEPTDDCMEIKASKINFVLSDTTDSKFTVNSKNPFGSGGVGQSMAGQSVQPESGTTVTAAEGAEIFNDYRARAYSGSSVSQGNIASGSYSHAEGESTTSSMRATHAEGRATTASGDYAHAEGSHAKAEAIASHAEGNYTTASRMASHAEGNTSEASGNSSHAEGIQTIASGEASHAEGEITTASGPYSHAEGVYNEASNYSSHVSGKYSKPMTDGGNTINQVGDVFVVGNGITVESRSNALRLAYEGTLYLTKAYKSTGADYAEFFEWLDGNPENEDRVGHFVTLHGDKIVMAKEGDYILGVVSGQPCIIGNSDEDWLGRWEHDDFNRFVKEYLAHNEVEVTPPSNLTEEELSKWSRDNELTERDGHYFKMETEVVEYITDSWRHKANPSYDPSQPYIERKDRKEWDAVGMVGVLSVIDDGTCLPNSYAKVSANGIATAAARREVDTDTWRVIERVTPNIVKIIFSIK